MKKYDEIKKLFVLNADEENALSMAKYMRNMFAFYGIPAPKRKELYKTFLKEEKKTKQIDWEFLEECYHDAHREFQYLVYDYLLFMKQYVIYEDIEKIRHYIIEKSWWDTIDFLCKVIGYVGLKDDRVGDLMLNWSLDKNIWIKRTAIEYQLNLNEKTNTNYLEKIIVNCLDNEEFFINKAIGWALRDYSKTNPGWVREFLHKYQGRMNALSIREASKYL